MNHEYRDWDSDPKAPKNTDPGPDCFTGEFYKIFKDLVPILKLFQWTEKEGMLPNSFYKANITLIPKPDKDNTEKENHMPISLLNRYKNPQQNISNLNWMTHQENYTAWPRRVHTRDGRMFNILRWISVIRHVNKIKPQITRSSQQTQKKHLTKFNPHLGLKTLNKVGIIYEKSTSYILSGKVLKAIL